MTTNNLIEVGALIRRKRTKKAPKTNSVKIYDGPSMLDGAPVIVLLTGLAKSSSNTKTGDMLQTWILRKDVAPHEAVKTGQDSSVCGSCPLRPSSKETRLALRDAGVSGMDRACYVRVFQAPLSTWRANRDKEVTPPAVVRALIAGRRVRRGSYGDPAAAPSWVWEMLDSRAESFTRKDTGYTHQWRSFPGLSGRVMASVHNRAEAAEAQALGFRTFRVTSNADDIAPGEILCPASKEAGFRTTCAKCGLCNGKRGAEDSRKNIAIPAH